MEYFRSLGYLCWGVLKRIYWLAPALATDPFDVLEKLGVHMNVPPIISWTLVGLGFLIAVLLTYHEQRMQATIATQERDNLKKTVIRPPRGKLDARDHAVIWNLNSLMWDLHGHDDREGIEKDYQNNIDTDIILERKCTHCGKPRNQLGDDVL
jgi:hypothetical protein